jgi:uncharacterized protein
MRHIKRFLSPTKQSFFLLNPRGTGKTTWIRDQFKNALWIDLLLPAKVQFYSAKPERLLDTLNGSTQLKTVVIDEQEERYDLSKTLKCLHG